MSRVKERGFAPFVVEELHRGPSDLLLFVFGVALAVATFGGVEGASVDHQHQS
jgi:hypothetical protein